MDKGLLADVVAMIERVRASEGDEQLVVSNTGAGYDIEGV
jgi:hypothetical protein